MLRTVTSLIPPHRQVILVGHDIRNELRVLNLLGFDFSAFSITTLDTQTLCRGEFAGQAVTLRRLLLALGCPFIKLHRGGNDTNFTLKAVLLLAIRNCVESEFKGRVAVMQKIALSPLPN
jgi:hypothetical protein